MIIKDYVVSRMISGPKPVAEQLIAISYAPFKAKSGLTRHIELLDSDSSSCLINTVCKLKFLAKMKTAKGKYVPSGFSSLHPADT